MPCLPAACPSLVADTGMSSSKILPGNEEDRTPKSFSHLRVDVEGGEAKATKNGPPPCDSSKRAAPRGGPVRRGSVGFFYRDAAARVDERQTESVQHESGERAADAGSAPPGQGEKEDPDGITTMFKELCLNHPW